MVLIPLPSGQPADLAYLIRAYSFRTCPHRACPHRADLDFGRAGGRAGGRGAFGAPSGRGSGAGSGPLSPLHPQASQAIRNLNEKHPEVREQIMDFKLCLWGSYF